jgi:hypothetical protein
VFFNDPVPCPDPAERAVKMATAMREAAGKLIASWRRRGRLLDCAETPFNVKSSIARSDPAKMRESLLFDRVKKLAERTL